MKSTVAYFCFHCRELENLCVSTKSSNDFKDFQFLSFCYFCNMYITQAWGQGGWILVKFFFFCEFMEWDRVEVQLNSHAKKEQG